MYLAREAHTIAFTQSLEKMMAENHAAIAATDERKRLRKQVAAAIYLNLTKEVIEVQRMDVEANRADAKAKLRDAEARRMDAEAKTRVEDTRIMLADLSNVDDDTRAWFMKRRADARETPDHRRHAPNTMALLLDFLCCSGLVVSLLDSTLRRTRSQFDV